MMRSDRFPVFSRSVLAAVLVAVSACDPAPEPARDAGMAMDHADHAMPVAAPPEIDTMPAAGRGRVQLTSEQERALGVTYTTAERMTVSREIRTVGRIDAPERSIADITPKIDGFVEELFVATTGEAVRRGQPLLTIYSPALVAAQEELLTARRLAAQVDPEVSEAWSSAQSMLEASRRRLGYWDITDEQIERIEETGEVTKTMQLVAPVSGIVLEKDVVEGQRVTSGMRLYRLADLSTVWVEGEVFERDLQFVGVGSQAHIEVTAYPGEHVMGNVSFVHPTVEISSRTNRVRVAVPNPGLRFKPGMFATVFFEVTAIRDDIAVPLEAVVVTGERNLVFVRDEEGLLDPHEVVLGARAGDRVQILSGLLEGETIVASANFLIDAESRLGATGGGMPGMQHAGHGEMIAPAADPDTVGQDTAGTDAHRGHDD